MNRFLIFALERSGSSSLAAALNRELSVVQEPFSSLTGDIETNEKFRELLENLGYRPEDLPQEPEDEFAYNRFHRLARDPDTCAAYLAALYARFTGAKHVRNTVSEEANLNILNWCHEHDIRIVYLTRRNLGRALLSRFLAQQAEIHNLGPEMEKRKRWEKTRFDPIDIEAFEAQLQMFRETEQHYRAALAGKPCFYLDYEQLYTGWQWRRRRTFAALCRFLSVDPAQLDQATLENYLFDPARKQTDRRALSRLPNYRAIKRLL